METSKPLSLPWVIHPKNLLQSLFLVLIGATSGICVWAFLAGGEIYDYQDTVDGVHLPEVDAVVCLAGGRGRIAAAGDVWYRYWEHSNFPIKGVGKSPAPPEVPIFYVSGMGRQANFSAIKRQVRSGVLEVLRPDNVVMERESRNTIENAEYLARYAADHGWSRILLITSRYHMKRSKHIFHRVLSALPEPIEVETLSVYQEPFEPGEWRSNFHGIKVTIIEYIKWIYMKAY